MKHTILFILLISFSVQMFSQNKMSYDDLKTGKFTYEGMEGEVEIIRTKKKQIEITNGGESKLISKIDWINDSTYVLTLKKMINSPGCLEKGDWIKSTILNRKGDKYECSFTSKKCGDGTAVLVKLE